MIQKMLQLFILSFVWINVAAAASFFQDVPAEHTYHEAIYNLQEKGIVEGYDDNTFKPEGLINRAEFLKIVLEARYPNELWNCDWGVFGEFMYFQDSNYQLESWYDPYICQGTYWKIVKGYNDGTFRPEANLNFAEASKIIANTFRLPDTFEYTNTGGHYESITNFPAPLPSSSPWYKVYIEYLTDKNAIPRTDIKPVDLLTRGEMAFIIDAISVPETPKAQALTLEDILINVDYNDSHDVFYTVIEIQSRWPDETLPTEFLKLTNSEDAYTRGMAFAWLGWWNNWDDQPDLANEYMQKAMEEGFKNGFSHRTYAITLRNMKEISVDDFFYHAEESLKFDPYNANARYMLLTFRSAIGVGLEEVPGHLQFIVYHPEYLTPHQHNVLVYERAEMAYDLYEALVEMDIHQPGRRMAIMQREIRNIEEQYNENRSLYVIDIDKIIADLNLAQPGPDEVLWDIDSNDYEVSLQHYDYLSGQASGQVDLYKACNTEENWCSEVFVIELEVDDFYYSQPEQRTNIGIPCGWDSYKPAYESHGNPYSAVKTTERGVIFTEAKTCFESSEDCDTGNFPTEDQFQDFLCDISNS